MAITKVTSGGISDIAAAVEGASDSNKFTDADHSKLNAIEASATVDQTNAEIKAAVEAATDSNTFTDADHTKLNGVAASSNNYVHPNHSGDVVSAADGAMTIQTDAVDIAMLSATGTPGNTTFLRGDNAWATAGSTSASDLTSGTLPIARIADGAVTAAKVAADVATQAELDTVSTVASAALPKAGGNMTGSVNFTDNSQIRLGSSNDLSIYHDGSDSIINEEGTGTLIVMSNGTGINLQKGTSETMAQFVVDGAVNLYHNNAKKIETTATGVTVTGRVSSTNLIVATSAPSSPAAGDFWFDSTSGTTAMKVYSGVGWDTMSNKFSASGGTETTYTSGGTQYKVHTFTSSGTFTADAGGTVDYLVIAGGGSGGGQHGGGGGAGGYRAATNFSIGASAYSITVGAGGAARAGSGNNTGNAGSNSVFSSITSIGGGGGEGWSSGAGNTAPSGGSGGGASLSSTGGAGTSGQGNAGGSSTNSSTFPNGGGGGGGSGSVGEASSNLSRAGNGGSGTANNYRTGSNETRAGGGGGGSHSPHAIGTGGSGGGGNGGLGNSGVGVAATANTGSGGGGSGSAGAYSGAGGSGIVIIRYAV